MAETEEHKGLIIVRESPEEESGERVDHPQKLLRIATMTRRLLEEARQASLDESGRQRLREIYTSSLQELKGALSEDLRKELEALAPRLEALPRRVGDPRGPGAAGGLARGSVPRNPGSPVVPAHAGPGAIPGHAAAGSPTWDAATGAWEGRTRQRQGFRIHLAAPRGVMCVAARRTTEVRARSPPAIRIPD
jgi:hypothetical protein